MGLDGKSFHRTNLKRSEESLQSDNIKVAKMFNKHLMRLA